MKQKIKIFLLGAIILSAFMLCSCCEQPRITLDCENLPEGYSAEVLVKLDEKDNDYNDNAKSGYIYSEAVTQTNSDSDSGNGYTSEMSAEDRYRAFLKQAESVGEKHLYYYNEDGWRSAQYFLRGCVELYSNDNFYLPSRSKSISTLVEDYPELKIAVTDSEGRVIQVSDVIKMLPEGKAFYYTEIDYDYAQNTAVASDPTYISADGKRPDYALFGLWLLSLLCNAATIVFIIIMLVARRRGHHRRFGYALTFGILSVCNILFTVKYSYLQLNPRYDLYSDGLTFDDLRKLFNLNLLWIAEFGIFLLIRFSPKVGGSNKMKRKEKLT
jgi:hypothetical protein